MVCLCLRAAVCLSVPMTCCVMGWEQAVRRPGLEPRTPALLRPPAASLLRPFLFVPVVSAAVDDDVLHVDVLGRFALIVNMLVVVLCFCCIGFIGVCAWCVVVGWCDANDPGWDAGCDRTC
eukprot:SAG31_NODE_1640_length_7666_cov_11.488437_1_plen_121_part_00